MKRDVVLITGGNSGIGFECARELARAGWHVVIASRDRRASAEAVRRIAGESGDGAASEMGLDLGSTASVRALARDIQAGHAGLRALVCVLPDHQLVTRGAYGFVRHPVYLAALLIWLGLAVGFQSTPAFLVMGVYVIPIYLLYIRSEEEMMLEAFGDAYRAYRREVPMLIPRLVRTTPTPRTAP